MALKDSYIAGALVATCGAVAVVAYVITKKGAGTAPKGPAMDGPGFPIVRKDRAAGVAPKLVGFLAEWERTGPFPIGVGADGGVRTDAALQLKYFNEGRSKARTLAETPHGRRGALDLNPIINGQWRGLDSDPDPEESERYFEIIARRAERYGLRAGKRFTFIKGGDKPHVEDPDWKSLPMPGSVALS